MADKTNKTQNVDLTEAFQQFLQQQSTLIERSTPEKKITPSEYRNLPGKREPVLARPVYQNGQKIQIRGCGDDTVKHLNALKPGKYLGGVVEVVVRGEAPNDEVTILYSIESPNDRIKVYSKVSSFADMVQQIYHEQLAREKNN